jgi:hypothetical protein
VICAVFRTDLILCFMALVEGIFSYPQHLLTLIVQ